VQHDKEQDGETTMRRAARHSKKLLRDAEERELARDLETN